MRVKVGVRVRSGIPGLWLRLWFSRVIRVIVRV